MAEADHIGWFSREETISSRSPDFLQLANYDFLEAALIRQLVLERVCVWHVRGPTCTVFSIS
jgi:hypothetical protein